MKIHMDGGLKKILVIFIVYKILILSFATASYYAVPEQFSHKNTELQNPLIRPWHQFDTRAYLDIATMGYNYEYGVTTTNFGWYPFYPFLIAALGFVGHDIAAYLLPQIFSFLAIASMYILLRQTWSERQTRKSIIYMLMFPSAYFLTALYTEPIFLFFSCMTFYFALKGRWHYAGVMGYFATLTRFVGISMFIPLLYMYMREKGFKIRNVDRKILLTLLVPAAFVTVMLYHYAAFGDPLLQFYTQGQFSRGIGLPHTAFLNTLNEIASTESLFVVLYNYFNIVMSLAFISILALCWKKIPPEYVMYVAFSFIMIFSSGILSSVTRFELMMFPIFAAMSGISEKSRRMSIAIAVIFSLFFFMQLLALANHVNGEIDIVSFYRSLLM